jgi:6-phosphogluconolactonase
VSDVQVYPDADTLTQAAAEHFVARAAEAVTARGKFTVALSGGSTPRSTYTLLANADNADRSGRQHPREFAPRVDWPRVHVFWGDERCVPPDHPDSNYRMARESLLLHVPIPTGNVHRIHCEGDPQQAADEYEQPSTRSQSGIAIPPGATQVRVRAHDPVDGYGGCEVVVDLTAPSGPDFEVIRQ